MCDFNFILDMGFSLKSNSRLQQQPFYSRKFGSFIIAVNYLFIYLFITIVEVAVNSKLKSWLVIAL